MATHTDSAATHGVTRGKLILIGVLAVVFVAVVYWNYFRDASADGDQVALAESKPATRPSAASPPSAKMPSATPPAGGRRADSPPKAEGEPLPPSGAQRAAARRSPWPEFTLTSVIAHDPFALPAAFPQPPATVAVDTTISDEELEAARLRAADERRAATLAEINRKGVELILLNGEEYVAKIGDEEVRVGDKIGGFRVVDISLRGVTLEGDNSP